MSNELSQCLHNPHFEKTYDIYTVSVHLTFFNPTLCTHQWYIYINNPSCLKKVFVTFSLIFYSFLWQDGEDLLMRKYMNCTYEINIYINMHIFLLFLLNVLSDSGERSLLSHRHSHQQLSVWTCIDPSLTVSRDESHMCVTLNFSLSARWCRHVVFKPKIYSAAL